MHTQRRWGWLALAWAAWSVGQACNVPVFRYALERWPPDPYRVIVFHRGPLATNAQAAVTDWQRATEDRNGTSVNAFVRTVDLDTAGDDPLAAVYRDQRASDLPRVCVLFPDTAAAFPGDIPPETAPELCALCPPTLSRTGEWALAWSGPLEPAAPASVLDSPARAELARRLLGGDSIVWLLVESGQTERDEAAFQTLTTELTRLQKDLQQAPPDDPDNPLTMPDEQYRIAFSVLRLSRADPAEAAFLHILLRTEPDLDAYRDQPIAVPVFGQGRALYALVGRGINADHITDATTFLSGPCSCEVKELNPGTDLPIRADWSRFALGAWVTSPEPPPLTGIAPDAPPATHAAAETPAPPPPVQKPAAIAPLAARAEPAPPAEPSPAAGRPLGRTIGIALGVAIVVLAVLTLGTRRKKQPHEPPTDA